MEFQWSAWIQAKAWALEVWGALSSWWAGKPVLYPAFPSSWRSAGGGGGKKVLCSHQASSHPGGLPSALKTGHSHFSCRAWNQRRPDVWRGAVLAMGMWDKVSGAISDKTMGSLECPFAPNIASAQLFLSFLSILALILKLGLHILWQPITRVVNPFEDLSLPQVVPSRSPPRPLHF